MSDGERRRRAVNKKRHPELMTGPEAISFLIQHPNGRALVCTKDLQSLLIERFSPRSGESTVVAQGHIHLLKHKKYGPGLYRLWIELKYDEAEGAE